SLPRTSTVYEPGVGAAFGLRSWGFLGAVVVMGCAFLCARRMVVRPAGAARRRANSAPAGVGGSGSRRGVGARVDVLDGLAAERGVEERLDGDRVPDDVAVRVRDLPDLGDLPVGDDDPDAGVTVLELEHVGAARELVGGDLDGVLAA